MSCSLRPNSCFRRSRFQSMQRCGEGGPGIATPSHPSAPDPIHRPLCALLHPAWILTCSAASCPDPHPLCCIILLHPSEQPPEPIPNPSNLFPSVLTSLQLYPSGTMGWGDPELMGVWLLHGCSCCLPAFILCSANHATVSCSFPRMSKIVLCTQKSPSSNMQVRRANPWLQRPTCTCLLSFFNDSSARISSMLLLSVPFSPAW